MVAWIIDHLTIGKFLTIQIRYLVPTVKWRSKYHTHSDFEWSTSVPIKSGSVFEWFWHKGHHFVNYYLKTELLKCLSDFNVSCSGPHCTYILLSYIIANHQLRVNLFYWICSRSGWTRWSKQDRLQFIVAWRRGFDQGCCSFWIRFCRQVIALFLLESGNRSTKMFVFWMFLVSECSVFGSPLYHSFG